jgi:hypothetical protein
MLAGFSFFVLGDRHAAKHIIIRLSPIGMLDSTRAEQASPERNNAVCQNNVTTAHEIEQSAPSGD